MNDFNPKEFDEAIELVDDQMNKVVPGLLNYIHEHLAPAVAARDYLAISAVLSALGIACESASQQYIMLAQSIAIRSMIKDED